MSGVQIGCQFLWKVKYNNGMLMFSCPSGSASNTGSSPLCLASVPTCSVGFFRTIMWYGRYSVNEPPFPLSQLASRGVTPCTRAKTVIHCLSALSALRMFSAGPYGISECRVSVKRTLCDIQEKYVSGWLLISNATHLLGPKRNPVSASVWVTFVRVILRAHSRV